MLKICKENKQSILEKVKNGHLDTASLCSKNLIDEIILAMYTNDILSYICKSIPDKRAHNKTCLLYTSSSARRILSISAL